MRTAVVFRSPEGKVERDFTEIYKELRVRVHDKHDKCVQTGCATTYEAIIGRMKDYNAPITGNHSKWTYDTLKNLHTFLFLLEIFGPIYYGPP